MFEPIEDKYQARLAVLGIGGGGCNAVNHMIESRLQGMEFYALNTDRQALSISKTEYKIQMGPQTTGGLGSGGDPEIGRRACEESEAQIKEILHELDMVFLTAGEGGGTGTGAAPLIAEWAKESGILTVAVVTKPFDFEGQIRRRQAEMGIAELKEKVDTLLVIPNQKLLSLQFDLPVVQAFRMPDEILLNATRGIADLITRPGLINLDFADVRSIMAEKGHALMGMGIARGENRAIEAVQKAISSPLVEGIFFQGAKGILLNITGGEELTLQEINEASTVISQANGDANIIFGVVTDPELGDAVKVTIIATGIEEPPPKVPEVYETLSPQRTDMKTPTFKRKEFISRNFERDDIEVPTFLRRQLD